MAWTIAQEVPAPVRHASGAIAKPLLDLVAGEIFSINAKARHLVLSNIDPKKEPRGEIVANALENGKPGSQFIFSFEEYRNCDVLVWGAVSDDGDKLKQPYEELDRVKLKNEEIQGTVLSLNESKFPDVDVITLWDQVVHGKWITEVHPHEIEHLGAKATGRAKDLALEAQNMVKERQEAEKRENGDDAKESFQESIKQQASRREEYGKELDNRRQASIVVSANEVIKSDHGEFRRIVQNAVLVATTGESNYEIDVLKEVSESYYEPISRRVAKQVKDYELVPAITAEILGILSGMMFDQYMLTREGYLQPVNGMWGIFNKKGKLIGKREAKKDALRHLKVIERRKRQTGEV